MLCYEEIIKAHKRISDKIYKTPLEKSHYLSNSHTNFYMKMESLQKVKSFKIRGAFSKMTMLTDEEKSRGVVAISSGNHGIAVSYAARVLGIENVEIIVPENTPDSKIQKIKYNGGKIKLVGKDYDQAHNYGVDYVKHNKMTYIDAYYSDELVYAGQGTMAIEILEENPDIDTILVPVGGGGMITGVAVAAKAINSDIKIIGIQPEACPAMLRAMEHNTFYENYPTEPSICEALVGGVGELSYEMSKKYIDEIILVSEANVKKAVSHIIKKEKFVVEPSSAICVGAIFQEKNRKWSSNVAMIMSGGNIDDQLITEILKEY